MNRIPVRQVVVVEGKYDAVALAGLIDGLILTTGGFSIFSDEEKKELIRRLGRQRGLLILTDSDAAGFSIRNYVEKIAGDCEIRHAYIPAVAGKERRKATPSKEGTLGVEGLSPDRLRKALEQAGVTSGPEEAPPKPTSRFITHTDLYEWGFSGGNGSAQRRRALLTRLDLPPRLSKRAMVEVLNSLYTYEEVERMAKAEPKPALFWDFHGTLTLPDHNWFDTAQEAAAEQAPEFELTREVLVQHLMGTCLPWFTLPGEDNRHLNEPGAWWAYCEERFAEMYQKCGMTPEQAQKAAPAIRAKVLEARRYILQPDAVDTLAELRRRGYRNYILSNNFPELGQIVGELGLGNLLEGIVVSGAVGYDKPRREIFDMARAMAWPDADNEANAPAVMIGDNPVDDMEGGKAAGFTTIQLGGEQNPAADHRVENLAKILDILP